MILSRLWMKTSVAICGQHLPPCYSISILRIDFKAMRVPNPPWLFSRSKMRMRDLIRRVPRIQWRVKWNPLEDGITFDKCKIVRYFAFRTGSNKDHTSTYLTASNPCQNEKLDFQYAMSSPLSTQLFTAY